MEGIIKEQYADVDLSSLPVGSELSKVEIEFEKRLGKFTASGNHRLMAGCDNTEEDHIRAIKSAHKKDELVALAESHGLDTSGTMEAIAARIYPMVSEALKNDIPKGGLTYIEEKVVEEMTGQLADFFETYDTLRGKELEPETVAIFQERTGLIVEDCLEDQLFREPSDYALVGHVGATPDGRIEKTLMNYGFEGKAPKATTHYRYIKGSISDKVDPLSSDNLRKLESNYWWQIITGLLCTGWDGWYFVSYHPDFKKDEDKMLIIFIDRKDPIVHADIEKLRNRLIRAIEIKRELL